MKLLMYGVSKDLVENGNEQQYQLNEQKCIQQLQDIKNLDGVMETVIIYSDYRTEYYFIVDENIFNHGEFLRYLASVTARPLEKVILETFSKFNYDVIAHLYRNLSGIERTFESTEDMIDAIENGIYLSTVVKSYKNSSLDSLFYSSIEFVIGILKSKDINMLLNSNADIIVKDILYEYANMQTTRFLVSGTDWRSQQISRMLYRAGAQYIRILGNTPDKSYEVARNLNKWANWIHPDAKRKIYFPVMNSSMNYHLSAADSIVIVNDIEELTAMHTTQNDIKSALHCNEKKIPKKQVIFDLSQKKHKIDYHTISNHIVYKNFIVKEDTVSSTFKDNIVEKLSEKVSTQIQQMSDAFIQSIN